MTDEIRYTDYRPGYYEDEDDNGWNMIWRTQEKQPLIEWLETEMIHAPNALPER